MRASTLRRKASDSDNSDKPIRLEANRLYTKTQQRELPPNLRETLKNAEEEYELIGEGFVDVAMAWLLGGGRTLSCAEMRAIWTDYLREWNKI